ncbi:glycosyltransferase family 2 protein, partial [bacterium]|nr:glycosyltransferase family 2 protein [bacterium]
MGRGRAHGALAARAAGPAGPGRDQPAPRRHLHVRAGGGRPRAAGKPRQLRQDPPGAGPLRRRRERPCSVKVSVAIITKDAAAQLDRCLASVAFADEVVVLDQGSRDDTAAVCARRGARVHQGAWEGFGPTKQRAAGLCRNRWVLSVDSDEEVSPELAAAIAALPEAPAEAAFAVNRLSRFLGAWIRHCG